MGLSPHVRGNRVGDRVQQLPGGSIPACTGKPPFTNYLSLGPVVYPRMYGETHDSTVSPATLVGLSPHVRGNQGMVGAFVPAVGSIPACTGKPDLAEEAATPLGVYPRMYGETAQPPPQLPSW